MQEQIAVNNAQVEMEIYVIIMEHVKIKHGGKPKPYLQMEMDYVYVMEMIQLVTG